MTENKNNFKINFFDNYHILYSKYYTDFFSSL